MAQARGRGQSGRAVWVMVRMWPEMGMDASEGFELRNAVCGLTSF